MQVTGGERGDVHERETSVYRTRFLPVYKAREQEINLYWEREKRGRSGREGRQVVTGIG